MLAGTESGISLPSIAIRLQNYSIKTQVSGKKNQSPGLTEIREKGENDVDN